MKKILKLYKKTLKPLEIEEIFDAYFFRVFSFIIVLPLKKTKLSPNYLTLLSMISGITAGIFFSYGDYKGLLYGVVALAITNILDCADGQLARLTGKSSRFGKTLDGIADIVTYVSIYTGVSYHLFVNNCSAGIFVYGFVSMMFMFLHIIYFDHFKNEFVSYVYPSYKEKSENLNELKKRYIQLKKRKEGTWILAYLYFLFYKIEYFFVSFGYPENYKGYYSLYGAVKRPSKKIIQAYYRYMRFIVRLWSFLGASSHLMLFFIFSLLNLPQLIFHTICIFYNVALAILVFYQKRRFKLLFQ